MFNHRLPQRPIDKGWTQMKARLDQEMPRQHRRRLLPWWFSALTFAGGILAGIAWAGMWQTNAPDGNAEAGPIRAAQATPPPTAQPARRLAQQAAAPARLLLPAAGSLRQEEAALHGDMTEKTISPVSSVAAIGGSHPAAVAVPDRLPSVFQSLTHLPSSPELTPVPAVAVIRKSRPSPHRIHLGLLAGANAFQVRQVPGWLGGITIDLSGRRQKWGLSTGVIYRHQEFSGENRPVIPISYDRYQAATASKALDPNTIPVASLYVARTNRILIPVMTSHQLEVPLTVFWQPFSRWRWYGGGALARHVWVESAANGLFTFDLRVVTTSDPDAAGNLNTAIKNQLPPWEFNWQSGIAFKPLRRWEVGLFYRSAWTGKAALADVDQLFGNCISCADKYPAAETRTRQSLRPRSLQFSVSYKF